MTPATIPASDKRFVITDAARDEIIERYGEAAALSIYAQVDVARPLLLGPVSLGYYAPNVVIAGDPIQFYADQIEELSR